MSRWFRWHSGTTEDGKFRMVARNAEVTVATVIGVWAVLLEDASHLEHRGVATRGEDFYAAILEISTEELQHILQFMDEIGLISVGHGAITITKWKERQFETDATDPTNADRQRRWREKHKKNADNTASNGTVTEAKHKDNDQIQNTETDKNIVRPVAKATRTKKSYEDDFEEFWREYPRTPTMSKVEAAKVWRGMSVDDRVLARKAIEPYRQFLRTKPNLETVHACRFLSQRRYDGFAPGADSAPVIDIRSNLV